MKGSFNDVKIKDKESDSLSWNNLSITFKFKNGVLLNFWLKGNNLKYTILVYYNLFLLAKNVKCIILKLLN